MEDYAELVLDRNQASQGSSIHLTITDYQLNIDPTSEDLVVFNTDVGNEGVSFFNGNATAAYIAYNNGFDDNGVLLITNNTNGEDILNATATLDDVRTNSYLFFTESGENTGIFTNTDDDDASNLLVGEYANRGFTATFDYNDSAQSFLVATDFGVIDMDETSVGDVWNSGEALTVTLIDQDLNKNTNSDKI